MLMVSEKSFRNFLKGNYGEKNLWKLLKVKFYVKSKKLKKIKNLGLLSQWGCSQKNMRFVWEATPSPYVCFKWKMTFAL